MTPIINQEAEPQYGDSALLAENNNKFQEECARATPEKTESMKQGYMAAFYTQSNSNEENPSDLESNENEKILQKFEDNPVYPIIDRFVNIELSHDEKLNVFKEEDILNIANYMTNNNTKGGDIIEDLEKSIDNIELSSFEATVYFSNYIQEIKNINQENKTVSTEGVYEIPKELEQIDLLTEQPENPVYQLIYENFTQFPDGQYGEVNLDKDIQTTFEICLNKIIDNKELKRTQGTEIAINDIRGDESMETKIKALSYLFGHVNTGENLKAHKNKASIHIIKKRNQEYILDYLEFKLDQLTTMIFDIHDNEEKQKLISQQTIIVHEIEKNEGELGGYDGILGGGELDILD
ncbi:MAG: hypothetical protein GY828_01360 [Candidatus Gracilibacteria bacterium]|nr:hypothetical protein [Candidatus Gracilibacteria bacterium]